MVRHMVAVAGAEVVQGIDWKRWDQDNPSVSGGVGTVTWDHGDSH